VWTFVEFPIKIRGIGPRYIYPTLALPSSAIRPYLCALPAPEKGYPKASSNRVAMRPGFTALLTIE
jgi:hypothetical protein